MNGTIVSAANTNLNNLNVSETAVTNNQDGNIVLNGAATNNKNTEVSSEANNNFQTNNDQTGSTLTLAANTGNNNASYNTGGNTTVSTGDANVSANSLAFVNNNIAGKVVYQTVDIYGELNGDIVLPSEAYNNIDGNGSDSTNKVTDTNSQTNASTQSNSAQIDNQINTDINTGGNSAAYNTGGDTNIVTGTASAQVNTLNVANNNIGPGDWWIVIINKAGDWAGSIIGGKTSNLNSSTDGQTTNVSGNGAGSNNQTASSDSHTNTNMQNNNSQIGNRLNLSANTGRNTTDYNTGGNSNIKTGKASIIANVANFVNNNVSAGGKLIITVVNIFGKWVGNFVPPGQQSKTADKPQSPTSNLQTSPKSVNDQVTAASTNNPPDETTLNQNITYPTPIVQTVLRGIGLTRRQVLTTPVPESTAINEKIQNTGNVLAAQAQSGSTPKKTVNINLAWFLFGLPVAIAAWFRQWLQH